MQKKTEITEKILFSFQSLSLKLFGNKILDKTIQLAYQIFSNLL